MELVRGGVVDRPWGVTLGSLARRALSGQLTLTAEDGKRYSILFERGAVVNADSPLTSDAVARIALTQHLVSSTQVPELVRHLAAAHYPDEVLALAKAARLSPDQLKRLRRQVIAQRAARTFSIDHGEFIVDDQPTLPPVDGAEVDIRAVIYLGARVNLSEPRLADDLRLLGTRFTLDPARAEDIPYFGFTDGEQAIVDGMKRGASVAELVAAHALLGPRTTHAVVYSLASCNAVKSTGRINAETAAPPTPKPTPVALAGAADPLSIRFRPSTTMAPTPIIPRTETPPNFVPPVPRAVTDTSPSLKRPTLPLPAIDDPNRITGTQRAMTDTSPAMGRTTTPPNTPRTTTSPPIARTATDPAVGRTATPQPRPSSPTMSRTSTLPSGEAPVASRTITDPLVARATSDVQSAQEAFRRGEMAMRRDQFALAITEFTRAKELGPKEPDYDAMLAWAKFCEAIDKKAIAADTRKVLENASRRADKPMLAMFYLGRVERMLGRDKEALVHFQAVLELQPHHKDAASEVRVLEGRLADKGLFGLKR